MAKKKESKDANNDVGATAAATQAKQPVPKVSIPTRRSRMTKETAKEMGLDASVYGDIDAKKAAK